MRRAINRHAFADAAIGVHRRCVVRVLALACSLFAIAAVARAQPTVTVRASSRIELEVRRADDGLLVRGALRDDLGVPLAGENVSLELSRAIVSQHSHGARVITRTVTALADGAFTTHFVVEHGDYVVDARYEGAAEHLGTSATRFFDLDRAHVDLRLAIEDGTRVDLGVPTHVLTIAATSEAGGAALSMLVTDETGTADLGHGITDADGVLLVAIDSAALGPPAAGRIVVRTPGDSGRAEAQSELPIVRFRATRTTLTLSTTTLSPGAAVEARGTLDDGVAPIEREAISLVGAGRVLTTVLTDDRGTFTARLDESNLVDLEGEVSVVARFDGAAPWIPPSESAAQTLHVRRPIALEWLWALAPVALAALVVAASLRRDPIRRVRERRPEGVAGVVLGARRSIVASRFDVSGVLLDAVSGEPIAFATVRAGPAETTSDARGAFTLQATRDASALHVEHREYVPLDAPLALPHRGEHEGMVLRLAGRRALSFAALREVAIELAPDGEVALSLTQRELLELMRARGASPPTLPDLVSRVESACYAKAPPSDADMAQIRRVAADLVAGSRARAPREAAVTGR
jgi:hypothetical protein